MAILKYFKGKVNKISAETLVIMGLLLIIITTFIINTIIGMYITAVLLIGTGLFIANGRR